MAEAPTVQSAPSRVPWGIWAGLGAFVLALVIAVVGDSAFQSVTKAFYNRHHLEWEIAAYQFLTAGVIVSVTLLMVTRHPSLQTLGFRFPGWRALGLAAASVLLVYVAISLLQGLFNTFLPSYHLQGNTNEILPEKHPALPLLEDAVIVLWAAIEAPLTEETLFRGVLFQGLRDGLAQRVPYQAAVFIGAVASGVLFGFVHGEPHTFPILALFGIFLAYVFQFARSIYASALLHGINNAIAVVVLLHGA